MRNDIHCPSNFVAADYTLIEYFGTVMITDESADRFDIKVPEGYGYEAITPEVEARWSGVYAHSTEKCDVCGAQYIHGSLWHHKPTNTYITIGQTCAETVGLSVDKKVRLRQAARIKRERQQRTWLLEGIAKARTFLADKPELRKAMTVKHHIIQDMTRGCVRWGSLSEKQIAFLTRLAKEAGEPKEVFEGIAPEGRVMVEGTILATKCYDSDWGTVIKMLVAVKNADGTKWKAWGTKPDALYGSDRGDKVTFAAKFAPADDDKHFAKFSRPTKAMSLQEAN